MSLPPGFLDELRNRVSLAQVVGRKLAWDPRKTNQGRGDYWAPCPFHQEKTASFHVDDAKGYYHCFGCQAGGDAIDFLRESENMGFMEAVETLARDAGMALPERDPAAAARAAATKGLAEPMEEAVRFYRLQLATGPATEARGYLDGRGLSEAALARFEIGYAPAGRTALLEHLKAKGYAPAKLDEAGLVGLPRDGGSAYDRFRNRIMFPIRDARGRAIAFGARAIAPGQEPKYLNSPETPLFDKSRSLYNVGPARAAAHKARSLIVAEGYMDVIALAQAGIEHAVAPLGTAITAEQLAQIWKLAPEPVVALDGDRAGLEAAHRLIDLALPLLEPGRALRFALMPADQDPDDVVRTGGAAAIEALLAASRPAVDLLWRRESEGQPLDSPERRAALDARLKAHLGRIADPGIRAHYEREFRARRAALFAPERPFRPARDRAWRAVIRTPLLPSSATRASPLASRRAGPEAEARIRESAILHGCIQHPAIAAEFEDRLERMNFSCPDLGKIRDALLSALDESLHQPDPSPALRNALGRRTGRDPIDHLLAPGQRSAFRHLEADANQELARRAIDEDMTRQFALMGLRSEIQDAIRELSSETADKIGWRLREAVDAERSAATTPLEQSANVDVETERKLSAELQERLDHHNARHPRKG